MSRITRRLAARLGVSVETEILNVEELRKVAEATPYDPDHQGLLAALRARYPESEINLVAVRGPGTMYENFAVDEAGARKENVKDWLEAEYHRLGDNARAVYDTHKESGLRWGESEVYTVVMTAPYGPEPDAFFQIEIDARRQIADAFVFNPYWPPEELDDLLHPSSCPDNPLVVTPTRYQFDRITNARRFIQQAAELDRQHKIAKLPELEKRTVQVVYVGEYNSKPEEVPYLELNPDWLSVPIKEVRFITDWAESSAGDHRLCDHWWLSIKDYEYQGERHLGFIPYWTMRHDDAPEVKSGDHGSIYSLMAALEEFDRIAEYPFAWFFFMLHGNRIGFRVGERVADGIREGKIGLLEKDAKVVARWMERQYGY